MQAALLEQIREAVEAFKANCLSVGMSEQTWAADLTIELSPVLVERWLIAEGELSGLFGARMAIREDLPEYSIYIESGRTATIAHLSEYALKNATGIVPQSSNAPSAVYTITAAQFVTDGYAAKITAGECRVYYFWMPPEASLDAPRDRALYAHTLQEYGNATEIGSIELMSEGYAYLNCVGGGMLGAGSDQSLLVVPNGVPWQIEPNL